MFRRWRSIGAEGDWEEVPGCQSGAMDTYTIKTDDHVRMRVIMPCFAFSTRPLAAMALILPLADTRRMNLVDAASRKRP